MPAEYYGPYRVTKTLGEGGMGTVYEAIHSRSGDQVAVKVIAAAIAKQPRFRRRFAGEVETLKKLEHPNIVKLIGYGEEQGTLFYSMELVRGVSLQQRLREVGRLGWKETLDLAAQVASALKHAHDFGVIHRDLKPANLMLTAEQQVKLTDFGIAKLFGWSDLTVAGSVIGTADYMAPEQSGDGTVTSRSDLYALGSVMYACIAGRPPFTGKQMTEVIHNLKYEEPPRLEVQAPDVPREVSELVHHLLQKEPADRPPTALVVRNRILAMQRGLANHPTLESGALKQTAWSADGELSTADKPTIEHSSDAGSEQITNSDKLTGDGGELGDSEHLGLSLDTPVDNQPDLSLQPEEQPATHFQTVELADRERSASIFGTSTPPKHDWHNYISAGLLLLCLVGLVAFVVWMLQPPSAASLLARIDAAEEAQDLPAAEAAVEDFLRLYPQHPRAERLKAELAAIDLEQDVRRLDNRAERLGGIDLLDPPEMSFLEAMNLRQRDPVAALQQLTLWQQVYDRPEIEDPELRRLQRVVEAAIDELQRVSPAEVETPARKLGQWADWGEEHLPPAERIAFYRGLIALYAERDWAENPLAVVRARLRELTSEADKSL